MRYALTIQEGDDFNSVNTLIIEDNLNEAECVESNKTWKDDKEELVDILRECGYDKESAEIIVSDHRYFIRNCDDIDFCLTDTLVNGNGEEITWKERRQEYANDNCKHEDIEWGDDDERGVCRVCGATCDWHWEKDVVDNYPDYIKEVEIRVPHEWHKKGEQNVCK